MALAPIWRNLPEFISGFVTQSDRAREPNTDRAPAAVIHPEEPSPMWLHPVQPAFRCGTSPAIGLRQIQAASWIAQAGSSPLSWRCGVRAKGSLRRWKSAASPDRGTGKERSRLGPGAIADPRGWGATALWWQVGGVSACVPLRFGSDAAGGRACCRCGLLGGTAQLAQGGHSAGSGVMLSLWFRSCAAYRCGEGPAWRGGRGANLSCAFSYRLSTRSA